MKQPVEGEWVEQYWNKAAIVSETDYMHKHLKLNEKSEGCLKEHDREYESVIQVSGTDV